MKYKKIELTQGKFAIIDASDFDLISQYKWYYRKSGKTNGTNGYAQHSPYKGKSIFMHNLIMEPKKPLCVDHINRNGIDNRRKNLRIGTVSQNFANFPKKKNTRSKYRGVSFLKRTNGKQWQCSTTLYGKNVYIGVFNTQEEAAFAYNKFALKYFGKFAQLNKI